MSDLLNLRKFVAPEIIFGRGARMLVGKYAQQFLAQKVLIVTDPGVIAAGWLEDVQHSLEACGIAYHVFSHVSPNPRSTEVSEGAEVYRQEACNMIVAIGGGSPMDCAKGIGIVVTNNLDILQFEGGGIKFSFPYHLWFLFLQRLAHQQTFPNFVLLAIKLSG